MHTKHAEVIKIKPAIKAIRYIYNSLALKDEIWNITHDLSINSSTHRTNIAVSKSESNRRSSSVLLFWSLTYVPFSVFTLLLLDMLAERLLRFAQPALFIKKLYRKTTYSMWRIYHINYEYLRASRIVYICI